MINVNLRMARLIDSLALGDQSQQLAPNDDLLSFSSSVATPIPGLSFGAQCGADLMVSLDLGIKPAKDASVVLSIAVNGEEQAASVTPKFIKRKKLTSVGLTFRLVGLSKNDVITAMLKTGNSNCDLLGVRRVIFSRWA